jgi:hypothetical protein
MLGDDSHVVSGEEFRGEKASVRLRAVVMLKTNKGTALLTKISYAAVDTCG